MAVHMSLRLAWHSDGWNGHICKKPCENVYCVGQHSYPGDMIAEQRDLDFETAHAGESCVQHPCKVACALSVNAFGKGTVQARVEVPSWWGEKNADAAILTLPPYTACTWCYEAMYKKDVFSTVKRKTYDYNKRQRNAEEYFAQFEEGKSLVFYYTGYSNPFSENEEDNYVIVGASRIKKIDDFHYYENTTEQIKNDYAGGVVWQKPVTSNYPDEGLAIPYWKYMNDEPILDRIVIKPLLRSPFKYGSRLTCFTTEKAPFATFCFTAGIGMPKSRYIKHIQAEQNGGYGMKINGFNNAGGAQQAAGQAGGPDDSYSRNIRNQIANAQKRLQEISSNQELSTEEKMKKRQEIQQEIANLNQQLRQHQMEQRREQQESRRAERASDSAQEGSEAQSGFSRAGMAAMISADSSVKQAKVQGSMAKQAEGKAAVLKTEISLDKNDTTAARKEKEIAELGERAQRATAGQMSSLADAGKEMERTTKEGGGAETVSKSGNRTERTDENEADDGDRTPKDEAESSAEETGQAAEWPVYRSVDVRL